MAKGSLDMTNFKTTADMVSGVADDSFIPPSKSSRKGSHIMSNRRMTSDETGGFQDIIGAMCVCGADETTHALASVKIDERIARNLKPMAAKVYMMAVEATNKEDFFCAAGKLLLPMAGDNGIGSIVKSISAAKQEFGDLGIMQRAIARRMNERCDYLCS